MTSRVMLHSLSSPLRTPKVNSERPFDYLYDSDYTVSTRRSSTPPLPGLMPVVKKAPLHMKKEAITLHTVAFDALPSPVPNNSVSVLRTKSSRPIQSAVVRAQRSFADVSGINRFKYVTITYRPNSCRPNLMSSSSPSKLSNGVIPTQHQQTTANIERTGVKVAETSFSSSGYASLINEAHTNPDLIQDNDHPKLPKTPKIRADKSSRPSTLTSHHSNTSEHRRKCSRCWRHAQPTEFQASSLQGLPLIPNLPSFSTTPIKAANLYENEHGRGQSAASNSNITITDSSNLTKSTSNEACAMKPTDSDVTMNCHIPNSAKTYQKMLQRNRRLVSAYAGKIPIKKMKDSISKRNNSGSIQSLVNKNLEIVNEIESRVDKLRQEKRDSSRSHGPSSASRSLVNSQCSSCHKVLGDKKSLEMHMLNVHNQSKSARTASARPFALETETHDGTTKSTSSRVGFLTAIPRSPSTTRRAVKVVSKKTVCTNTESTNEAPVDAEVQTDQLTPNLDLQVSLAIDGSGPGFHYARTGYEIFFDSHFEEPNQEKENNVQELAREIGEKWIELRGEDKQRWKNLAALEGELYNSRLQRLKITPESSSTVTQPSKMVQTESQEPRLNSSTHITMCSLEPNTSDVRPSGPTPNTADVHYTVDASTALDLFIDAAIEDGIEKYSLSKTEIDMEPNHRCIRKQINQDFLLDAQDYLLHTLLPDALHAVGNMQLEENGINKA